MARATQTMRILNVFASADAQQVAAGLGWYAEAHRIAGDLSASTGVSIAQASGILAALSPQVSWGFNVEWAYGVAQGDTTRRGLGLSLGRALMIQRNPDTDPLDILGGRKVRAFYSAILSSGFTDQVVIDRHAFDLAEDSRGAHLSLTDKRSRVAAENYRTAAKRLQRDGVMITACQLQAVTWLTWRSRYWSEGAWDGYATDRSRAPQVEKVAF